MKMEMTLTALADYIQSFLSGTDPVHEEWTDNAGYSTHTIVNRYEEVLIIDYTRTVYDTVSGISVYDSRD